MVNVSVREEDMITPSSYLITSEIELGMNALQLSYSPVSERQHHFCRFCQAARASRKDTKIGSGYLEEQFSYLGFDYYYHY